MTRGSPRTIVAILLGQVALGILAMAICLPSMPSWVDTFDEPLSRVQLTFASFLVGYALTQLIYGPLSDSFGRRRVLLLGLALGTAGSAGAALAPSLDALIAARALQGAGVCAGMVIGRAMIQDMFAGAERTRVLAMVGVISGCCPPLATLLGGHLHEMFSWRAPFVAITIMTVVMAIAALAGLPADSGTDQSRRNVRSMVMSYGHLFKDQQFLACCLVLAFTVAGFYVFLAAMPSVLDAYGVTPARMGWYILMVPASYIVGNALTARIAHRVSSRYLMVVGQWLTLLSVVIVLLLAFAGVHHPLAVAVPLTLLGIGHGLLVPPTLAGAVGSIPALAGAAAALAGMLQQSFGAAASYVTGFVDQSTALGMAGLMVLFAVLASLSQWYLLHQVAKSAVQGGEVLSRP